MNARTRTVALAVAGVAGALTLAHATTLETVEVSAPVFPKVLVMYQGEGANYPTTPAAREALVDATALTYDFLRADCAANGYAITQTDGGVLTPAQLAANYNAVADCSYARYTAKPYWIPQLLLDVDVCGRTLGAGWRLLSQADLEGFRAADFQYLHDTLAATGGSASSMGSFYFSPRVFVAATDGGLLEGNLDPAAAERLAPLPGGALNVHLEAGLALRCIRRTQ